MRRVGDPKVRADQLAWVHAQFELDRYMTTLLPRLLLVPPRSDDSDACLTREQLREVARLYGRLVGTWSHYMESLRLAGDPAATDVSTSPAVSSTEDIRT